MRTPIIHADEYGYLMAAHYLARGGLPTGTPYSPGYSLLLVPSWWLSSSTATEYRWALDTNALLGGVTTVLLYLLARRLGPDLRRLTAAGVAVAVSAYPALLLSADIAESENLLFPGFLAVCLLVLGALERPTPARWGAAGAATGLLFLVHERALVVAVGLVIVAIGFLRPWPAHARALAAGAACLAATLAGGEALTRYVTASVPGYQLPRSGSTPGGLLSRLGSASGLTHLGVEMAGQGLYVLVGAGALLVLGLIALGSRRPWRSLGALPPTGLAAFLLLCLLGQAVLAGIFLATGSRVDDAIYGRYLEAFIPPVLVAGAVAGAGLRRAPGRGRTLASAAAVGAAGLAGLSGAVAAHWGPTLHGPVVMSNVFAVSELLRSTQVRLSLAVLGAVGLGALLVVLGGLRLSAGLGLALAVALSVPATFFGYSYLIDQSTGRLPQRSLPAAVVEIAEGAGRVGCVSWDDSVDDAWSFYNTRLFAPQIRFPVFDSRRGRSLPCASGLVVAGPGFGRNPRYPGARLVLAQPAPESLWVMPGRISRWLAAHPLQREAPAG